MTSFHIQTVTFTAIDVSFFSSVAILIFNWQVLPDLHGSDHFPIIIPIRKVNHKLAFLVGAQIKQIGNFSQSFVLQTSVEKFDSSDEVAIFITDVIHSAALFSIPKISGHFLRHPVPWWTQKSGEFSLYGGILKG